MQLIVQNLIDKLTQDKTFIDNLKHLKRDYPYLKQKQLPLKMTQVVKYAINDRHILLKTDIKKAALTFITTFCNPILAEELSKLNKTQYTVLHGILQTKLPLYKEVYHNFMAHTRYRLYSKLAKLYSDINIVQVLHDEIHYLIENNNDLIKKINELTELKVFKVIFQLQHVKFHFLFKEDGYVLAYGEPDFMKFDLGDQLYNQLLEHILNQPLLRNALFSMLISSDPNLIMSFREKLKQYFTNDKYPGFFHILDNFVDAVLRLKGRFNLGRY